MEVRAFMIDYTVTESGVFVESTLTRKKYEPQSGNEERAKKEGEPFTEFWVFVRLRNEWLLWSIKQSMSIVSDLQRMQRSEVLAMLSRKLKSKKVDDGFLYQDGPACSGRKQTG